MDGLAALHHEARLHCAFLPRADTPLQGGVPGGGVQQKPSTLLVNLSGVITPQAISVSGTRLE